MVVHQSGMEIEATRVDAAAAKRAEELFDERVADQAKPRTAIDVDPSLFDRYVWGYYELGLGPSSPSRARAIGCSRS